MSQPFKLFRLQQIDSQIDKIQVRLREIDSILQQDELLREAQAQLAEMERLLEKGRKALRTAEENVHTQRLKIEQTEASLYGGKIRNPKELQDLQNEAASLKRYRSVLEDQQLDAMIAVEEAEAAQNAAASELEQVQAVHNDQQRALRLEQNSLQNEMARLETERHAVANTIPETDLMLYDNLRRQRRGVAVSKVANKACSACGTVLNAALLDAARSPNQITRCDICGRILYAG